MYNPASPSCRKSSSAGDWHSKHGNLFVSDEPLGFVAGDDSLVRYVGNSPTNAVDPSGYYKRFTTVVTVGHSAKALQMAIEAANADGGATIGPGFVAGIGCSTGSNGTVNNQLVNYRIPPGLPKLPWSVWRPDPKVEPPVPVGIIREQQERTERGIIDTEFGFSRPRNPKIKWPAVPPDGAPKVDILTNIRNKYRAVMSEHFAAVIEHGANEMIRNTCDWNVTYKFQPGIMLNPKNVLADVDLWETKDLVVGGRIRLDIMTSGDEIKIRIHASNIVPLQGNFYTLIGILGR